MFKGKIKLFTDKDLDGVGCAILLKFAKENIKIQPVSRAEDRDSIFKDFCENSLDKYNKVFMTDMSIKAETLEEMISKYPSLESKFVLLDHHATAMELNRFDCCTVEEFTDESKKHKTCGTTLVFKFLIENGIFPKDTQKIIHLKQFVSDVRNYDTWEWKKINHIKSEELNELYSAYSFSVFLQTFYERLKFDDSYYFSDEEKFLISIQNKNLENFCYQQIKRVKPCTFFGAKGGFLFCEQNTSYLGNFLCQKFPQYDYILLINLNKGTCSLRTVSDTFDCLSIAKPLGGGGHIQACGFATKEIKNFITREVNAL